MSPADGTEKQDDTESRDHAPTSGSVASGQSRTPGPELLEALWALADDLDRAAHDRQAWADHPEIGGSKPRFGAHLRGKRYGYSHAAQLIRAALSLTSGQSHAPGPTQALLPHLSMIEWALMEASNSVLPEHEAGRAAALRWIREEGPQGAYALLFDLERYEARTAEAV